MRISFLQIKLSLGLIASDSKQICKCQAVLRWHWWDKTGHILNVLWVLDLEPLSFQSLSSKIALFLCFSCLWFYLKWERWRFNTDPQSLQAFRHIRISGSVLRPFSPFSVNGRWVNEESLSFVLSGEQCFPVEGILTQWISLYPQNYLQLPMCIRVCF